jgi:citrate lyase subunit beta / citryl-CoA lyase
LNPVLRSLLFVPANRSDRFDKALASGADAVIFDLEDAIEPRRKDEARQIAGDYLVGARPSASRVKRLLRVNAFDSPWYADDVAMAATLQGLDGVVLPKCASPGEVAALAAAVEPAAVLPLLETAQGIVNAAAIAGAAAPIAALIFGAEDLTAQLGIPRTVDGDELIYARSQVVLAAATAGADAIDAVLIHITALDDLRRDALRARALGFVGKMAIHPSQVPVINEVFTPSAQEIDQARRVIEAYQRAEAHGNGVVRLDDRMVDRPVVARARRVVEIAAALDVPQAGKT